MQTIQLQATSHPGYPYPETVDVHLIKSELANSDQLDDALAVILQAVHQSGNPKSMAALGTLLAYMESLEKRQTETSAAQTWVTLASPMTLSL